MADDNIVFQCHCRGCGFRADEKRPLTLHLEGKRHRVCEDYENELVATKNPALSYIRTMIKHEDDIDLLVNIPEDEKQYTTPKYINNSRAISKRSGDTVIVSFVPKIKT